jgi:hypothetical protein
MPRNGSDIYYIPPGTEGFPDTTIESAKYNTYIHDVETDLNRPRPISSGGTGANDADEALANLHAEKAGQEITNFDSDVLMAGSFFSKISATNPPVALHAFSGIVHITDANNMVMEAVDLTDPLHKSYMRVKTAGVWGPWEGVSIVTCADDPPTGNRASDNALWWESDTGLLYIRYNDGDSSQWTIACPQPDISTYAIKIETVAKAGDTMTGDLTVSKTDATVTINSTGGLGASGKARLVLNKTQSIIGSSALIAGLSDNKLRWEIAVAATGEESGGNTGSGFALYSYADDGSTGLGAPLYFYRDTGLGKVIGNPTDPLGIATKQYVDARGTVYLQNSVVFDPPSLATNIVGVIQTLTVTGAAVGDFCLASFSTDLNGMTLLAWVSVANTVMFQFQNKTAGTLDLASGTVRVRVWKQ